MTMRTDLAITAATLPPAGAGASSRGETARGRSLHGPVVDFLLPGGCSFLVLGAMAAFRPVPITIDALSGYDQAVFGATLFLFIGWTFINIHHYFMDNVIWRRENPETRQHLFGGGAR